MDVHIEEILYRKYPYDATSDLFRDLGQFYRDAHESLVLIQSMKENSDYVKCWPQKWQEIHDHLNMAIWNIDYVRKMIYAQDRGKNSW